MARLIPPKGLKEIGVETKRGRKVLKTGKDGLFHVENPRLIRKLKDEGLGEAAVSGYSVSGGYPCLECGFGSWFKKCSRCGTTNNRTEMDGSSG